MSPEITRAKYNILFITFSQSRVFARNHFNVANFTSPAGCALALVRVLHLLTHGSVHTRIGSAPVDEFFAVFASETVRAVASVILQVIDARGSVGTGRRVALVNSGLTITSSVTVNRERERKHYKERQLLRLNFELFQNMKIGERNI